MTAVRANATEGQHIAAPPHADDAQTLTSKSTRPIACVYSNCTDPATQRAVWPKLEGHTQPSPVAFCELHSQIVLHIFCIELEPLAPVEGEPEEVLR